jgi:putative transposase
LYQGRFKSFPIEQDEHFYTVARYVERNPLRAQLVERAEDWRYGSLWLRSAGAAAERSLLAQWPLPLPRQWTAHVNGPQTEAEAEAVRRSISKSAPFGGEAWTRRTVAALGLEHTQRPRGRPPKPKDDIRLPSPLVLRMSPFLFQIASVHSAHPVQQFASRRDA